MTVLVNYPIYKINCSYLCLLTTCVHRSIRNLQSSYVYALDAAMLEMLDLS